MTVSYNLDVSRNSWHAVVKLLMRWRGSIWKLVWKEMLLWLFLYYVVMFIYRSDYFLTHVQKSDFEKLAAHIRNRLDWVPLTFLLGFFVSMVVDRWRQIFLNMGWIENLSLTVATLVRGPETENVRIRRNIIRYVCLSQVLVFRDISKRVRLRFPNMESIVQACFMDEHELTIFEKIALQNHNKHWVPMNWACALVFRARDSNSIKSEPALIAVLNEIKFFRTNLMQLCNYDWVPVPLAYPQVVFVAVRIYFALCLVGRQYIIGEHAENRSTIDLVFPMMTLLQFLFYIGWMKVAESLLNPLGEDDDHFECNQLIDKNILTGLSIVDDTYDQPPEQRDDRFATLPALLYSEKAMAAQPRRNGSVFAGSAAHLILAKKDQPVPMAPLPETPYNEVVEDTADPPSFRKTFSFSSLRQRMSRRGTQSSIVSEEGGMSQKKRTGSNSELESPCKHMGRGGFHRTFNGRGAKNSIGSEDQFDCSFDESPFTTSLSSAGAAHFNFGHSTSSPHKLERVEEEEGRGSTELACADVSPLSSSPDDLNHQEISRPTSALEATNGQETDSSHTQAEELATQRERNLPEKSSDSPQMNPD